MTGSGDLINGPPSTHNDDPPTALSELYWFVFYIELNSSLFKLEYPYFSPVNFSLSEEPVEDGALSAVAATKSPIIFIGDG